MAQHSFSNSSSQQSGARCSAQTWSDQKDGYEMLKRIGQGAFSEVYEARHKSDGRMVAVKVIDKSAMRAKNLIERIKTEFSIHQRLQHTSCIELLAGFECTQSVYFVMELCEKGNMHELLKKRGRLPEDECQKYFLQLVDGVQFIHSHGIVHRDLKLPNLLLSHDNTVKVADFGLAVQLTDEKEQRNTICGTPNYIAPEIVQSQPYDQTVDIWSLGVMLYTMLIGTPPFESGDIQRTLRRVASSSTKVLHLPNHLSSEARDLLFGILKPNPKQRLTLKQIRKHAFMTPSRPPLKALNTERLQPRQHDTQNGTINLLETGEIVYESKKDRSKVSISSDGQQIRHAFWTGEVSTYTLNSLPNELHRRYNVLRKFVDIVRSRSPKIHLDFEQGRCTMMDNGPEHNFEIMFHDDTEVEVNPSSGSQLVLRFGDRSKSTVPFNIAEGRSFPDRPISDPRTRDKLKHICQVIQQCREAERNHPRGPWPLHLQSNCETARQQRRVDPVTPAVKPMNLNNSWSFHTSSTSSSHSSVQPTPARQCPQSTRNGRARSSNRNNSVEPMHRESRPNDSIITTNSDPLPISPKPPDRRASRRHESNSAGRSTYRREGSAPPTSSRNSRGSGGHTKPVLKVIHSNATELTIENVGKAIKTGEGKITVNFFDGDTIIMPPRSREVIFIGGEGEYERFTPGARTLAGHVQGKMSLAGKFIQLWLG